MALKYLEKLEFYKLFLANWSTIFSKLMIINSFFS